MPVATKIQHRRGTASQWTSTNPVLASGEIGIESDTNKIKFGNGTTNWAGLPYFGTGAVPGGGTSTTFLRGDMTWAPVENPVRSFAELQTAVAAGGTIRIDNNFPFACTAQIDITKPCHIIGGDLTLPTDTDFPLFRVLSSNVTFDNIRFTGGGTAGSFWSNSRFILVDGTSTNILRKIKIKGCDMEGSMNENVRMLWTTHSSVTDCTMNNFRYAGVMLLSVSDVKVIGNTITESPLISPVVNVYGVACSDIENTEAARCKNVSIIGNTIRNIMWEGIDTHGGYNLVISNNTVTGCPRGIALVVGNATRLTVPNNNIVDANIIIRDGALWSGVEREGLCLYGLTGNLADANITNNIIQGYSDKPLYIDFGTVAHDKTLVANNSFPHKKWASIVLNNTAQWTANPTFGPEYMVDGKRVYLRGMVSSQSTVTGSTKIGTIPVEFAPTERTFYTASAGSSSSASYGQIEINTLGEIWMQYRRVGDLYSYNLDGDFERTITNV